jgi:pSer/pThr/pTyr-binding forkhead associated (FHA) protein
VVRCLALDRLHRTPIEIPRENGQVWLDSTGVSRQHARITVDGDQVTLEDLKSKNGTRVRGHLVTTAAPLADGDEIRFGSIAVTFRIWAEGEATRTETRTETRTDPSSSAD